MSAALRPRHLLKVALTVALAGLAGCVANPNSVFHSRTDFNRDVSGLFILILWLGTIVFVFTEVMLLIAIVKYRARPGAPRPEQVHGNTKLEILWTAIPAVVLAAIAVPTVTTIFKTQSRASADALQIEVIGHQWWWEFRYPQFGITTANEVYMPLGRTVSFSLATADVIHSFWIPGLGGKRDAVYNPTGGNSGWLKYRQAHIWFTADSTTEDAFNGFCAEYCGTSHANMRFRAFVVSPENFDSWVAHQQKPAVFPAAAPAPAPRGRAARAAAPAPIPAQLSGFIGFDRAKMPAYTIPQTPIPASIAYDTTLVGDATRGAALTASGACIACHTVKGVPTLQAKVGPDLTHVGSRLTIGGGLFQNDTKHLASWIKNSPAMKPGSFMQTLGIGQFDPKTKITLQFGLTDQQIADIVAYLQALK